MTIRTSSIDTWVFDKLHLKQYENIEPIIDSFILITHLGDGLILSVITFCLLITLLVKRQYKVAALWVFLILGTFLFSNFLKQHFSLSRPDDIYHLIHVSSPAFPSGHALRSTVVYLTGAIIVLSSFNFKKSRKLILGGALLLPFMIGVSRLLLGVHWASDIFAGWIIGLIIYWIFSISLGKTKPPKPLAIKRPD